MNELNDKLVLPSALQNKTTITEEDVERIKQSVTAKQQERAEKEKSIQQTNEINNEVADLQNQLNDEQETLNILKEQNEELIKYINKNSLVSQEVCYI